MSVVAMSQSTSLSQAAKPPYRNEAEEAEYAKDPKAFLLKRAEKLLHTVKVTHNHVLVVTYYAPKFKMLAGGQKFFMSDNATKESEYQGKVGLVVAKGPMAFVDDGDVKFQGQNVEKGDWIFYMPTAGWQLALDSLHCRMLKETDIRGVTLDPEFVY